MTSSGRKRIRKDPATRRAEIIDTAAVVALSEGLECVTLRRVADELAVQPGLISHYFPSAEDLVAEAFGTAAGRDLDSLLPPESDSPPVERLARFLGRTSGEAYEAVSRLWLNARHLSRYRPVLAAEVAQQEDAWRSRLSEAIRAGVESGDFYTDDPELVTMQILVVIDGLSTHSNADTGERPSAIARMAITTAERELGLTLGSLACDTTVGVSV